MDNAAENASFVISALHDRQKQMQAMNIDSASIDPFTLLKEVAEMSNFKA